MLHRITGSGRRYGIPRLEGVFVEIRDQADDGIVGIFMKKATLFDTSHHKGMFRIGRNRRTGFHHPRIPVTLPVR